ncbi:MAG: hypothetical protein Ct9H300mP1_07170 [Planctomycetaceae bacterium]|nr:MAG: hypothetical protein Ct9H300mP1_07170 [Planctomycetaceae bacterium]
MVTRKSPVDRHFPGRRQDLDTWPDGLWVPPACRWLLNPREITGHVAIKKFVGEIPTDFSSADYPNIHFHKDTILLHYDRNLKFGPKRGLLDIESVSHQRSIRMTVVSRRQPINPERSHPKCLSPNRWPDLPETPHAAVPCAVEHPGGRNPLPGPRVSR